jgi:threonylcarbamoyladenosine tRNA methylthiotransferase MtaB
MKYAVVTFGCRVNQSDSLAAEEGLLALGATSTAPERADVVLVNTCSVTASADQAARQTIRRIARINPSAKIIATGCYATHRPDDIRGLPQVVGVVPNDNKVQLVQIIRDSWRADTGGRSARSGEPLGEGPCGAPLEPGVAGRTAFTLRVQTGCGERCSYCIIPTTRGRPTSVPLDVLLAEVGRVVGVGFKEIALTGVHLGSYGRDLTPSSSLVTLLGALERWAGADQRRAAPRVLFRISSLEPMDCSQEVVELVAASRFFAPHFHLPLQHASDRMLTAMRRPYSFGYYRDLVAGIRARIPHASIGSDVIIGFPGESDHDFSTLLDYVESCPLTHVHVFPYSDRPGTDASAMGGKVPAPVVRERARLVRTTAARLTDAFRETQLGTLHEGLTIEDGSLVVTGNYLKVKVPPGRFRNEWVTVRVTGVGDPLTGEIVAPF